MAVNSYPNPPISTGQVPLRDYVTHASVKAIYASENASASSVITLTPDTTVLEITAIGGPAGVRWVATGDGQASVVTAAGGNAAFIIPSGTVRKFAVPIEGLYQAPSSMVGINIQNGLYRRVAYKTVGNASVFLSEF